MRKIRGFRLNLRVKEVLRRLRKAKLDPPPSGPPEESALLDLAARFCGAARPSVLYDSFPAGGDASPLVSIPGPAYSLALGTLGAEADAFIAGLSADAPRLRPILDVMASVALDETARFSLGLIEEEARQERCELSPIEYFVEIPACRAVVERLEGHKIGMAVSPEGLRPSRSFACSVSWLSRDRAIRRGQSAADRAKNAK